MAVTLVAASSVTEQVLELPLQAPPQVAKVELASGVAVSVTVVPSGKLAEHSRVQDSTEVVPATPLTVPRPAPLVSTLSAQSMTSKVAVAERAALRPTLQIAFEPEHAPDQPTKRWPLVGVAVSVTTLPTAKDWQPVPQAAPVNEVPTLP